MREGAKERVERKWVGVGVVMSTGPGILGASQAGGGHDGTRTAGSRAYPWATRETFPIKNIKNEDCRIAEASIIGFSEKSKLRSVRTPLPS